MFLDYNIRSLYQRVVSGAIRRNNYELASRISLKTTPWVTGKFPKIDATIIPDGSVRVTFREMACSH